VVQARRDEQADQGERQEGRHGDANEAPTHELASGAGNCMIAVMITRTIEPL
jgi:hypothetical protein